MKLKTASFQLSHNRCFFRFRADEIGVNIQDFIGNILPRKKRKRTVGKQARKVLQQEESEKLINMDDVISEAIEKQNKRVLFSLMKLIKLLEVKTQKVVLMSPGRGSKDILPIVEGSTIMTKYGPVKTDYMLFIAAGAFHFSKPSDLIPELQGRFL